MKLLVGVGNVGLEYEKTRHNIGFKAIDKICENYNFSKIGKKFNAEVFSGNLNGENLLLIKPLTYMNNSGLAVLEAANFYKISPKEIFVFHDEIDLKLGVIKMKIGGGSAGHNGLKSIDAAIGNEYWRIRMGVDRPQNKEYEIADYVLGKFLKEEENSVQEMIERAVESLPEILQNEIIK